MLPPIYHTEQSKTQPEENLITITSSTGALHFPKMSAQPSLQQNSKSIAQICKNIRSTMIVGRNTMTTLEPEFDLNIGSKPLSKKRQSYVGIASKHQRNKMQTLNHESLTSKLLQPVLLSKN